MSNKARNYTEPTKKKLFALSGNQCAYPNCTNKLIAEDGITVVGEIAHIQAASEKGARYYPLISDEERADFSNLMLLCPEHHKTIDNKENEEKYPIKLLKKWKAEHEAKHEKDQIQVPDTVIEQITNKLELSLNQLLKNYSSFNEVKDFGIIEEIFKYVFSQIEITYDIDIRQDKLLELKLKIPENFSNKDDAKIMRQYFSDLWFRKDIIERFIANENQEKIKSLKIDVQRNYRLYRNVKDTETPIEDFNIIEKMAEKYIPKNKLSNPDYFANATALVLYFFEQCDFGKKTENENSDNQLKFEL